MESSKVDCEKCKAYTWNLEARWSVLILHSVNEQTGDEHSSALLQSPRSAIYNACTYQEKESLVKSKRSWSQLR